MTKIRDVPAKYIPEVASLERELTGRILDCDVASSTRDIAASYSVAAEPVYNVRTISREEKRFRREQEFDDEDDIPDLVDLFDR